MRPHCIYAMMMLMACVAYLDDAIAERERAAGKRKVDVAFDARQFQRAVMRNARSGRRGSSEQATSMIPEVITA